jgi:hypothetical protein
MTRGQRGEHFSSRPFDSPRQERRVSLRAKLKKRFVKKAGLEPKTDVAMSEI